MKTRSLAHFFWEKDQYKKQAETQELSVMPLNEELQEGALLAVLC